MSEVKSISEKEEKTETVKNKSLPAHSHNGHRQRVRERFYKTGFKGMADHNVLEMLLFCGIPRRDTNQLAHDLIDTFGSYSAVLEANKDDLIKVKGMTESAACLITMVLPLYNRYIECLHDDKLKLVETEEIVEYLRPKFFAGGCRERVFALCYDSGGNLIVCREVCEGDISSVNFDIKEFVKLVLETSCTSVILVHNHPHAVAAPSQYDIDTTKDIYTFLDAINIEFLNHIIVSDTSYCSMKDLPKTMSIFYGLGKIEDLVTVNVDNERRKKSK